MTSVGTWEPPGQDWPKTDISGSYSGRGSSIKERSDNTTLRWWWWWWWWWYIIIIIIIIINYMGVWGGCLCNRYYTVPLYQRFALWRWRSTCPKCGVVTIDWRWKLEGRERQGLLVLVAKTGLELKSCIMLRCIRRARRRFNIKRYSDLQSWIHC